MKRIFDFNAEFEEIMQKREVDTVVILGHINPDGDAAGTVLGLAHYLKDVYPQYQVFPYLSSQLGKGPMKMAGNEKVLLPFQLPNVSRYAVIVCDTATKERIEGKELYEQAVCSMVLDHHISNEEYGEINYVKESESCAENVFYILDWERWSRSPYRNTEYPNACDYLYLGIVHDTWGFSRAEDTTMDAAAELIRMGVDHKKIYATIQNDTIKIVKTRAAIMSMVETVEDDCAAYVYIDRETAREKGIEYEDIHPISSLLKECEEIRMAFTMFEETEGRWRCSFRSDISWIDVNELAGVFGGGGHPGAAGLRKETQDGKGLLSDILTELSLRIKKN